MAPPIIVATRIVDLTIRALDALGRFIVNVRAKRAAKVEKVKRREQAAGKAASEAFGGYRKELWCPICGEPTPHGYECDTCAQILDGKYDPSGRRGK